MPSPIQKFFSVPESFRRTEGFLYKTFRFSPVRQKFPTKPWCAPSHVWKFSIKEFSWNTKVFSNEIFRYIMKKTSTESCDTPPLLSIKYFSLPATFWNTEWFPGEVFSVLWEKQFFDETVKLPPSFAWNFSIAEIFRNTEVYRHWETNKSRRKILILPPPLSLIHKILRHGKTCETKKGSPGRFSVLWDNNICIENR